MKKFGYTRVSTDEQDDSLQRRALEQYGVDHIFSDKMTGAVMDRPNLNRALKVLRPGDELVVWKLDRLGRSLIGVIDAVEKLTEKDIRVVSLSEGIDPKTPIGKFVLAIIAGFAQMERDLISERTKAGLAAYKARGGKMGKKHFVLDHPKRLERFREIWPLVQDGTLVGREVVEKMHEAQPEPRIKSVQSYYNWRKDGFKGFDPDKPLDPPQDG